MRGFPALLLAIAVARAQPHQAIAQTVWQGPGVTLLGSPSRDGRFLSFVEPGTGHLGLRDVARQTSRILVKAEPKQYAYFSTIAPDNSSVAYAWFNAQGFYDLRTVNPATGAVRTIYSNEEAGFVQPCAYSPDGRQILTLLFRKDNISQIALVPAAGGPPRVLKSLNWVYPKKMDFSPDGQHIVYDSFADERGPDRTLFLLRADGAGEQRLLKTPGNHMFPVWTPAGIVYASGNDLMLLPRPEAEPEVWQQGLGRLVPLGVSRQGDYFYGLRSGTLDIEVASLDQPGARPQSVSLRFPGRNSEPAWSPDGSRIAYLSRRGMENFGQEMRTLVIRTLAGTPELKGEHQAEHKAEQEIDAHLAHLAWVRWSADGRKLLVAGTDGQGRGGLFEVDPAQPAPRLLVRDDDAGPQGLDAVWRNGKELAYLDAAGLHFWTNGKSTLLVPGSGFSHLASHAGELAWLSPAGIHRYGQPLLKAPVDGLTELVLAGSALWSGGGAAAALLAGNGRDLWRIPLDGAPPQLIPLQTKRTGHLSLHPGGRRLAYTTGGTESSIHTLRVPGVVTP